MYLVFTFVTFDARRLLPFYHRADAPYTGFFLIGSVTDTFQGYDADHADIDLLRLRNYTIGKTLSDDELVETGGMDRVTDLLTCMKPFVSGSFSVPPADRCSPAPVREFHGAAPQVVSRPGRPRSG